MTRLISVGNLEAAVSLLLSSAPDSPYFYPNALRAVALSSAVSKSLLDLALKVSCLTILIIFCVLLKNYVHHFRCTYRLLQPTW